MLENSRAAESRCPFPFARSAGPLSPPPEYALLREREPVRRVDLWNGANAWIFTRWADVREILANPDFSAVPSTPGYPMLSPARASALDSYQSFITLDPPDHTFFRRMVTKEFTVKRMNALRPQVQAVADRLLDAMAARNQPGDLVRDLAGPLPSIVISMMLGVPARHHHDMEILGAQKNDLTVDPAVPAEATRKMVEIIGAVLDDKIRDPGHGEDLLSRLVIDQIRPGHLSRRDAVNIANLLYLAGHETTTNQIALSTVVLLHNPAQRAAMLASPEALAAGVEEMLRFNTIVQYNSARVATADVEIAGHTIRAGDGVYALLTAANHDPAAFPDPERFDVTRDASAHMAFSFGVHQCVGQSLARMELACVFETLFRRFPALELAVPFAALEFKDEQLVHGLRRLPVRW
ncbi:cytochrome P450 [Sphingomonas sp. TF3]|uniref:cytochrome P450 n=1 Tax=Sphingomonas sp. TF3 TaxID=2495580 RepID=UPI000F85E1E1|nr:cytochrome P450 [Sphingomonas sp. TF3]RUN76540.1 cytochrome P450 [Sphingomonas sp. TF3]